MSSWDQFYQLSVLEIDFKDSLSTSAVIYGNGRNQVAISIHVRVMSSVTTVLPLTEQEVFDAIYLCNYRDGSRLSSDWQLSKTPGDYVGAVNYLSANSADSLTPGDNFLTCYLSCGKAIPSTLIALGIDIPGVGRFDTSEHGTNTLNGSGGESGSFFKNPQNITISALEPINYNLPSNLSISNGWKNFSQMNLISDTLPCNISSNHSPENGSEGSVNKGKAYYSTLRIFTKERWPFRAKKIVNPVHTLMGYTLAGRDGVNGADLVFGLNTRDEHNPTPVQVFDTSIVFVDTTTFGVLSSNNGGLSISGANKQYRQTTWKLKIPLNAQTYPNNVDNSSVSVSMIHIRHCAYFYTGEEWVNDELNGLLDQVITVWDIYGNIGSIVLSVSSNKENIGELIVNGVPVSSYS
ncbi:hypothetical protein [Candidatus Symbiopectobacterium sp. NZEC135]|uniref:hypothetical protein n=1 Tax=Candidatus Symbiopectobacterium sp. NZEC135 TaxID=2820471 RepID=UPI00222754D7|nr:hypothetical protein [Candidatus Symbiopectobacterium sp. NZEC135]MCW2481673.1 hypothetical protein [Candidatus Symbiopectobacterium sp. NZEC135]